MSQNYTREVNHHGIGLCRVCIRLVRIRWNARKSEPITVSGVAYAAVLAVMASYTSVRTLEYVSADVTDWDGRHMLLLACGWIMAIALHRSHTRTTRRGL